MTVQIDRLTSEQYEEEVSIQNPYTCCIRLIVEIKDVTGIIDLIEVIRIQQSGPTEAARALRKKLYVACMQSPPNADTVLGSMAMCTVNFAPWSSSML